MSEKINNRLLKEKPADEQNVDGYTLYRGKLNYTGREKNWEINVDRIK